MNTLKLLPLSLCLAVLAGCSKEHDDAHEGDEAAHHDQEAGPHTERPPDPNILAIPESVRQNLGITFVKAERRRVAATLRAPGRFEPLPSSRREYNAVLPGRIELLVQQFQAVEAGTPLYRIESPEWMKLRQQLQEELAAIDKSEAEVAVAEAIRTEAEKAVKLLEHRIGALAEAAVRKVELEAELESRRNSLPRLEAELRAKKAEHQAAEQRFPLTVASAASVLAMDSAKLMEDLGDAANPKPRWKTIEAVEVRAAQAGVVDSIGTTNGAWLDGNKLVLSTVNTSALRFRAVALQADMGRLRDGLNASIVPPASGGRDAKPLPGKLMLALAANPQSRTIELIVTPENAGGWARAGVSGFLEVTLDEGEDPEVAIPTAALIQDELSRIFFRRDPKNPNQVIRTEADLGISDGHWVVVNSGLKAGDEVVVDGIYELKLASSAKGGGGPKGHYHADGTFHEEKDGEK